MPPSSTGGGVVSRDGTGVRALCTSARLGRRMLVVARVRDCGGAGDPRSFAQRRPGANVAGGAGPFFGALVVHDPDADAVARSSGLILLRRRQQTVGKVSRHADERATRPDAVDDAVDQGPGRRAARRRARWGRRAVVVPSIEASPIAIVVVAAPQSRATVQVTRPTPSKAARRAAIATAVGGLGNAVHGSLPAPSVRRTALGEGVCDAHSDGGPGGEALALARHAG